MGKKVPASATTRKRIEELMDGSTVSADARSELLKLAMRVFLEEAGEVEVRDAVGREYYRHGERRGHRTGYRPARLASAEGEIEFAVPQVRGSPAGAARFGSRSPDGPRSSSGSRSRCTRADCRCAISSAPSPIVGGIAGPADTHGGVGGHGTAVGGLPGVSEP